MIKAAIFDLDGTLCDTLEDINRAVNESRKVYHLGPITARDVLVFVNGDTREFVKEGIPTVKEDGIEEALRVYKSFYSECYMDKTTPYKGMKEVLEALKKKGIKLAVFSNKADEYVRNMAGKYFPGLFDFTLGSGIYKSKPDPEGIGVILKNLGVSENEFVYIGDSDVDYYTAKNSGTEGILVTWGYRSKEHLNSIGCHNTADTMDELLQKILNA